MKRTVVLLLAALLTSLLLFPKPAASQSANCTPPEKLDADMAYCLQTGQDAEYVHNAVCTVVACTPKTGPVPKFCMDNVALGRGIQSCLSQNSSAYVYGNTSCFSVRCGTRAGAGGSQNSPGGNGSYLIGQLTIIGSKYGAILGGAATALIALGGWYLTRKKKSRMGEYLTRIDSTYSDFKTDMQECESELRKLKRSITEDLKKGSLDESTYGILEKRIDDYIDEIKEQKKRDKAPGGI